MRDLYSEILRGILLEKDDRCTRIAKQKYDVWPSAYSSGAVVRCRKGDIWKDVKESIDFNNADNKDAAEYVYMDINPDLKKVGTLDQYYKYLKTIFPNSKLKDFLYHSTDNTIAGGFDSTKTTTGGKSKTKGFHFHTMPSRLYGKNLYIVILNITNLFDANKEGLTYEQTRAIEYFDKDLLSMYLKDSGKNIDLRSFDGYSMLRGTEYVVERPEQIHILGSKDDLEGFKKYVQTKSTNESDFSKEKEQGLHGWFSRQGGEGKSKGWVDCNTCKKDPVTGNKKCKSCGRQAGEKRSKYPSCRPTPAQCDTPGKGKSWGKIKKD